MFTGGQAQIGDDLPSIHQTDDIRIDPRHRDRDGACRPGHGFRKRTRPSKGHFKRDDLFLIPLPAVDTRIGTRFQGERCPDLRALEVARHPFLKIRDPYPDIPCHKVVLANGQGTPVKIAHQVLSLVPLRLAEPILRQSGLKDQHLRLAGSHGPAPNREHKVLAAIPDFAHGPGFSPLDRLVQRGSLRLGDNAVDRDRLRQDLPRRVQAVLSCFHGLVLHEFSALFHHARAQVRQPFLPFTLHGVPRLHPRLRQRKARGRPRLHVQASRLGNAVRLRVRIPVSPRLEPDRPLCLLASIQAQGDVVSKCPDHHLDGRLAQQALPFRTFAYPRKIGFVVDPRSRTGNGRCDIDVDGEGDLLRHIGFTGVDARIGTRHQLDGFTAANGPPLERTGHAGVQIRERDPDRFRDKGFVRDFIRPPLQIGRQVDRLVARAGDNTLLGMAVLVDGDARRPHADGTPIQRNLRRAAVLHHGDAPFGRPFDFPFDPCGLRIRENPLRPGVSEETACLLQPCET